ncbi:recombinase family protein [Anaerocolumna sp. AGMB13020]|uniref:recombinase family protein n=1 Tax=Anaerocolumna sp. AGMB13020 TaxID=3081750 RepID=UPI0029550323|nr:recombinase family protein [Anaerocolumna sp. AGMB13020]WOO36140.1 recombinase family protein [Anaerocolumna sp. AGMB13020]
MNIAIYSRKSKFTEKGESIDNQVQYCRTYGDTHLLHIPDKNYIIYEDEGFSAATSMRPKFQQLLQDINANKIQMLLCYRLDRITRKVSDFSKTLELLEQRKVGFISATENFDTSTPMGKAMIYIASVFAQLERETTAERVRDNMLALSKTGRWLGGLTPMGYTSKEIIYLDSEFREKKLYQLIPVEKDLKTVALLFEKYLELGSLSAVENYCLVHGITTQKGGSFYKSSIANILSNPTYCIGDAASYDYFSSLGCCITFPPEKFNGGSGILCYNRTSQQNKASRNKRPPDQWVVALGKHKGLVSGNTFIRTQKLLKENSEKASPRKDTSSYALVSGKIHCANCGSAMRVKNIRKAGDKIYYSYACEQKIFSKKMNCNISNLNGKLFDDYLLELISTILLGAVNYNKLLRLLQDKRTVLQEDDLEYKQRLDSLNNEKKDIKKEIETIITRLATDSSPILQKYFLPKLEELDLRIREIQITMDSMAPNGQGADHFTFSESFPEFLRTIIMSSELSQKKVLINTLIQNITWDGQQASITLV